MKNYYVGLDVHSRESVFVVQDDAGVIVARGAIPTTASGLLQTARQLWPSGWNQRRTRDRNFGIFRGS
jgi:hypothetical protein